jgi:hypothetical protein
MLPSRAGWMTTLIQRARTSGVANGDIAATLESSIVFRPLTIARNDRDGLVGVIADADMTMTDLFNVPDEDSRTR